MAESPTNEPGLGAFQIFPDEVILKILKWVARIPEDYQRTLFRLRRVSRCFSKRTLARSGLGRIKGLGIAKCSC